MELEFLFLSKANITSCSVVFCGRRSLYWLHSEDWKCIFHYGYRWMAKCYGSGGYSSQCHCDFTRKFLDYYCSTHILENVPLFKKCHIYEDLPFGSPSPGLVAVDILVKNMQWAGSQITLNFVGTAELRVVCKRLFINIYIYFIYFLCKFKNETCDNVCLFCITWSWIKLCWKLTLLAL